MSWKHITTLSDPGSSNGYSFLSYYYKSFITVSEKGNLHESEKKESSNRSLQRSYGTMILWILHRLPSGNYLTQYQI